MSDFVVAAGQTFRADHMNVGVPVSPPGPGTVAELLLNSDGSFSYIIRHSITEDIVFRVDSTGPVIPMPPDGPLDEGGSIMLGAVTADFVFTDFASGGPVVVGTATNHTWADVRVAVFPGPQYRIDIQPETLGSIFPFFMGDDTVVLGDGDDVFYDYGGNLEMTLGGGHDEAWLYEEMGATTFKEVYGGAGSDTINYQGGDGEIFGGSGRDVIGPAGGNHGSWTLVGGLGNDTVDGYAGPGTMIVDGNNSGDDSYSGNAATVLSYASATGSLLVDLSAASVTGTTTGTDQISGISHVVGSIAGDTMLAHPNAMGDVTFEGRGGADQLQCGTGADRLLGGFGADTLSGSAGSDTIEGGGGNDVITGGDGRDLLRGGAGADVFVYAATSDSTNALAGRDRIADFDMVLDRIDLTAVDARSVTPALDGFVFIGTAAFSAVGQVRFEHVGTTTVVMANTAGASGAELRIDLAGLHGLTADNFLL